MKSLEGDFLKGLFSAFNQSDYKYCVLRNHEHLPNSLGGGDLDLLVLPNERDDIARLVTSMAGRYGGAVISEYTTMGRYMKLLGCYNGKWWGAAIDLMPGLDYRGVVYLDAKAVIKRSWDYKGIKVASPVDVDMMALIKELLNNGKTRKQYVPDAISAYQEYGDSALEAARASFGDVFANDLGLWLKSQHSPNPDTEKVASVALRMRKAIKKRHGSGQKKSSLSNFWRRILRILKPPGIVITITGTDGSGKTTVINQITPVLNEALHGNVQYAHLRPHYLPALGAVAGKRTKENNEVVIDPHAQKPSGLIGSLVRLAYYGVDYTLGYWITIYPLIVKKSHLHLFDRYYYDMMIDPRRMRISLPKWILKMCFLVVPQPKLVICLGADPETLYQRKPETSLKEVARQVKELQHFAKNTKNAIWVDTAQDLQGTVNEVLVAIQTTMSNRYYK